MEEETTYKLFDQDPKKENRIKVKVSCINGFLLIKPEGYEDLHGGEPITIELYEGSLRVIIWSDINEEDPTHIINIDKAKVEKRKE